MGSTILFCILSPGLNLFLTFVVSYRAMTSSMLCTIAKTGRNRARAGAREGQHGLNSFPTRQVMHAMHEVAGPLCALLLMLLTDAI